MDYVPFKGSSMAPIPSESDLVASLPLLSDTFFSHFDRDYHFNRDYGSFIQDQSKLLASKMTFFRDLLLGNHF